MEEEWKIEAEAKIGSYYIIDQAIEASWPTPANTPF